MKEFLQDVKFWVQDLEPADVVVVSVFSILEFAWVATMFILIKRFI
jgi:hypothetical protein